MNNILVPEQYGFRTHFSTEQAAFTLINSILTAMNNSHIVGGIFCDLHKAFDCVNHKILLEKLEFYGVVGKFKTLIESYLTDRYQRVALDNITKNNSFCKWERIKCGVPQGSILGPVLFLIYINDLPTIVNKNNNMVLFAVDTSIIVTDTNRHDLNISANQMFHDLNSWFHVNLLTLNYNKTQYLEFRTKNYYNVTKQIKFNHEYITNATEIKFLGLTIDDTLSWKQHIEQLVNKMCSACYALRNVKHIVPEDTLRIIYFAHIHAIISYSIIFWGSSYHANKVFTLQKKIIRTITNTEPRDSCRTDSKKLKIIIYIPSTYIHLSYTLLIINIYLMQIMKYINIKLGITITYIFHLPVYQNLIKELIYQE